MPRYDYKCSNCGYVFEAEQRITEEPLTDCPKCNGRISRIISKNVGIAFKGDGFYINDSSSKPSGS